MKKFLFLAYTCTTLCLLAACLHRTRLWQPFTRQNDRLSPLRVEGAYLVNAQGVRIQLRGVNIGAWLLIEPWILAVPDDPAVVAEKDIWDLMAQRFGREKALELIRTYRQNFFTEGDVAYIAQLGLNCLRIPIWWRAVSDPTYGGEFAYLDRAIEWCSQHGLYVILDLHGAPGGQSSESKIVGERSTGELWKSKMWQEKTINWWKEVAQRYKGCSTIAGFDLLNEAMDAEMDDLIALYDHLYQAIRAIDPNRILIIEDGLLGFHRLPRPSDLGWSNVVYSIHYYPQTTQEGLGAPEHDFHRINRSALWFGVPVYIGEFNTIQLNRGGAAAFSRYVEVFDYFSWHWTWWTYKKLEDNRDMNWGITGYADATRPINVHTDSFDSIRSAFTKLKTDGLDRHPLLETAVRQKPRWKRSSPEPNTVSLELDTVHIYPQNLGGIRYEWGRYIPNIGYWGPGDRIAWPVNISEAGTYEFGISYANHQSNNAARIWLDGVFVADASLINSGGWESYRNQALVAFELSPGRHVIEITQADAANSFINLRKGWLKKTLVPADRPQETVIHMHPLTAAPLRKGSPVRVEWWNNPPNFAYWVSGERVAWCLNLVSGGVYQVSVTYGTPHPRTMLTFAINGTASFAAQLEGTGGWPTFTNVTPTASVRLGAGRQKIEVIWETSQRAEVGNLRHIVLTRVAD